jgi:hypothetical protein
MRLFSGGFDNGDKTRRLAAVDDWQVDFHG